MSSEVLRETRSVCPICQKNIPAFHVREEGGVYLKKHCDEHGDFSCIIWRDLVSYEDWIAREAAPDSESGLECPQNCGLCGNHLNGTCCVLLEVTKRCNLQCSFCFAEGGEEGEDIPFEKIVEDIKKLTVKGKTLLQLSGGEPTVRDDLPEIIRAAKEAGCAYVQLNSNGLRLAAEPGYAQKLRDAGLSFVFMQFDGISDGVYETLRGRPLFEIKKKAIEHCGAANLGVTLVPTLVPGLNTGQIGDILNFAAENSPAVRGVHFQPVSYFGRTPDLPSDDGRFMLDELIHALYAQSDRLVPEGSLAPSCCDHALCGLHGDYIVMPEGNLYALHLDTAADCCGADPGDSDCCCDPAAADRNREFVARRWQRPDQPDCCCTLAEEDCCCTPTEEPCCGGGEVSPDDAPKSWDLDEFYDRVRSHGFTISAMAFQDVGNFDIERLRRCSLHVFADGRHYPFCAYYALGRGEGR